MNNHIAVKDRIDNIVGRNTRKRQIIEYLRDTDYIVANKREIPYALYYFSCNIDHFLFGDPNPKQADKARNADSFGREFFSAERFKEWIANNDYCCSRDYEQSWKLLRNRNGSLQRRSNIDLLVKRILESTIDEWK